MKVNPATNTLRLTATNSGKESGKEFIAFPGPNGYY
jgi:hypothetical protein